GSTMDTLYMFYKKGSCRGYTGTPSAWTKADSLPVSLKGTVSADTLVHISSQLNYNMNAGDTLAIYFTYKSVNVAYTNGTFLDSVYRKKSTITILQDFGVAYKFGSTFMPRVFNGVVHFCDGTALGINEVTKTESALYPNPMSSSATLTISNDVCLANARLVISDISGRIVKTQEHITSHNISIDKGSLGDGMYFYSLTENNKVIASGKLVIIQ
ncbi:MAG TPA: T9SS type A sorting domain-containing protein, partial [Bacteroidia bacterium]|nr:T9SS type A sorting domain-containing protein [Bacteroidia bacterium]